MHVGLNKPSAVACHRDCARIVRRCVLDQRVNALTTTREWCVPLDKRIMTITCNVGTLCSILPHAHTEHDLHCGQTPYSSGSAQGVT